MKKQKLQLAFKTFLSLVSFFLLFETRVVAQVSSEPSIAGKGEVNVAKKTKQAVTDGVTTARLKFSDPQKRGTLKIVVPLAELEIKGTNEDEIIITSTIEEKGSSVIGSDGFRRLDPPASFELFEKDNIATLQVIGSGSEHAYASEFNIYVPQNTNIIIQTQGGDDIEIENIDGDIEINTVNGKISLEDIGGSIVANTNNGDIEIEFNNSPKKPVSLTTMKGNIELELPSYAKANLRMRTHSGSIRTNFSEKSLVITSEGTEKGDFEKNTQPVFSKTKAIIGKLNGGGVEIQLTTMNGNIKLKEDD